MTHLTTTYMFVAITDGVKISVQTMFQPFYSNAAGEEYVFSYEVTIENQSDFTIQLLRRHWFIFDSLGKMEEVEGEGVIGRQPIIEPGDRHTYLSGCNLRTPIGKMLGTYMMERVKDGKIFDVEIPSFTMIVPHLLN